MICCSAVSSRHSQSSQMIRSILGARIGFISILHTWGQNLMHHPHVHCIVTAAVSHQRGTAGCQRKNFFIHVKVLSKLFKYKFLDYLRPALKRALLSSPAVSVTSWSPVPSRGSESAFYYKSGLSIASRRSAVPRESFSIWADIPTGSPSAITAS